MPYELYHHGIKGQKWGKRNGPPYPLEPEDHSKSEKQAGWQQSLNNSNKTISEQEARSSINDGRDFVDTHSETKSPRHRIHLSDDAKDFLTTVGVATATGLIIYGVYQLGTSGQLPIDFSDIFDETIDVSKFPFPSGEAGEMWRQIDVVETSSNSYHKAANFVEQAKAIGQKGKNAVGYYSASNYLDMNMFLRGVPGYDEAHVGKKTVQMVSDLTEVLEKTRIKDDVILHRGMGWDGLYKSLGLPSKSALETLLDSDPNALKGVVFTEKGFCSTGISPSAAFGGTTMHIFAKAGTKGMYIDPISTFQGERELLLQRGSVFKIVDYEMKPSGAVTDIFVEIVDQVLS